MTFVCGEDSWGPWSSSQDRLQDCFTFVLFQGFTGLLLLFVAVGRIWLLTNNIFLSQNEFTLQNPHKVQLLFVFATASISAAVTLTKILDQDPQPYEITTLLISTFAWVFTFGASFRSFKKGYKFGPSFLSFMLVVLASFVILLWNSAESKSREDSGELVHNLQLCNFVFIFLSLACSAISDVYHSTEYTKLTNIQEDVVDGRQKVHPEASAGAFHLITFQFMQPLMQLGYKRSLTPGDICPLTEADKASNLKQSLQSYWDAQVSTGKESLVEALKACFGYDFYIGGVYRLLNDACALFSPFALKEIIRFVEDEDDEYEEWYGYMWGVILFLAQAGQSFAGNQYFYKVIRVAFRTRGALMSMIYAKSLKLNNESKQSTTVGSIVNLQSSDCQRIMDLVINLHLSWSSPLQIAVALIFLYDLLGPAAFAGIGMLLVVLPVQFYVAVIMEGRKKSAMTNADQRVKSINEVLQAISIVKLYAWEESFSNRIHKIRDEELFHLKRVGYMRALSMFLLISAPVLIAAVSFAVRAALGEDLSADIVYPAIALFFLIQSPMIFFPMFIGNFVEGRVAISRISNFLRQGEVGQQLVDTRVQAGLVKVANGAFSWNASDLDPSKGYGSIVQSEAGFALRNLIFSIKPHEFVALVGETGSGKSSIFSALLGDMYQISGNISIGGRVSFASQTPWIFNATLRDNILYGTPFENERYKQVLRVCALERDLEILPAGDMTEIGEKGINLSGGQKQRVNLARAIYRDADVFLFDDPISAVDAHVGRFIFEECFQKYLAGKTRFISLNQVQYLGSFDQIVLIRNGIIREMGDYKTLVSAGKEFSRLIETYGGSHDKEEAKDEKAKDAKDLESKEKKNIIEVEERAVGSVKGQVYLAYFHAAGGKSTFFWILFWCSLGQASQVLSNWWIGYWATDSIQPDPGVGLYLGVYFTFNVLYGLTAFIVAFIFAIATPKAGYKLHSDMLVRILRSPMSFFDTTPIGRILNRFSKDIDECDNTISFDMQLLLRTSFGFLSIIAVICYTTPPFLAPLVPILVGFVYAQNYYRSTSRELKRIESVSRSPIYAHLSESLNGLSTIRAFGALPQAIDDNHAKIDENNAVSWVSFLANRWLSLRLECCGAILVLFASILAIVSRDSLPTELIGLSLSYSLQITFLLTGIVRLLAETEAAMNSVERILHYCELPSEAAPHIPEKQPQKEWPTKGQIEFHGVEMSYRPDLPLVLKGISCSIKQGEKIGICGRTGAGKSTIMLTLFRLVELRKGKIVIDGVDISQIGLFDLRSRMAIIAQQPTLFSGTMRSNLDPFNKYNDEEIYDALSHVNMKDLIVRNGGLQVPVVEGGENFSVGQRQLICLARALLKKSQIIMIDEATASVDVETDAQIQRSIRTHFAHATVLTIAHRLNTVIDVDRILVLDNGRIGEFDHPHQLLNREDSLFSGLVNETGAATSQLLRQQAKQSWDQRLI